MRVCAREGNRKRVRVREEEVRVREKRAERQFDIAENI